MKGEYRLRTIIFAFALVIVLVFTAYLFSGALFDRLTTSEEENPVATVSLLAVATGGLGGTIEHIHLPDYLSEFGEYDIGVYVVGLRSEGNVVTKISFSSPGISLGDLDVYYYDGISDSWKYLTLSDEGDALVGTLGPAGGVAMYEGFDALHRLLVMSNMNGECLTEAWVEII